MIFLVEENIESRIDIWLANLMAPSFSRSQIQSLIKEGSILLNDNVTNAKQKLKLGDRISVILPQLKEAKPKAQNIDLDILYEDQDIIVINKPKNFVVHPGAGNVDNTLVNALLYHCPDSLSGIGGVKRPGIVHRLDKNTSGVMVIAKNDNSHRNLSEQFADHGKNGQLQRKYVALIWGSLGQPSGKIENYLARSNKNRTKKCVVSKNATGAKYALTYYRILREYYLQNTTKPIISMVQCILSTGRTHQIRVHMSSKSCPLLGDKEYGAGFKTKIENLPLAIKSAIMNLQGQALHAQYLQFIHPNNAKLMCYSTDLPCDMNQLINLLNQDEAILSVDYK